MIRHGDRLHFYKLLGKPPVRNTIDTMEKIKELNYITNNLYYFDQDIPMAEVLAKQKAITQSESFQKMLIKVREHILNPNASYVPPLIDIDCNSKNPNTQEFLRQLKNDLNELSAYCRDPSDFEPSITSDWIIKVTDKVEFKNNPESLLIKTFSPRANKKIQNWMDGNYLVHFITLIKVVFGIPESDIAFHSIWENLVTVEKSILNTHLWKQRCNPDDMQQKNDEAREQTPIPEVNHMQLDFRNVKN